MKAAYLQNQAVHVGTLPDPVPGTGQVLVRTHSCGLCASDAHVYALGPKVVAASREFGGPYGHLDLARPFVPGHEFVGEILDYGPGTQQRLRPGTRVTSAPVLRHAGGHEIIGYSHDYPGGFGEYMLLDAAALMEVPAVVDDAMASMIEPLSVGLEHARMGEPTADDVPLVVGCGAIGLGVIAGLRLRNIRPIVAADLDPQRRAVALATGADLALDPRASSPYGPLPALGGRRVTLIYECMAQPSAPVRTVVDPRRP